jgi:hypothetical protein
MFPVIGEACKESAVNAIYTLHGHIATIDKHTIVDLLVRLHLFELVIWIEFESWPQSAIDLS